MRWSKCMGGLLFGACVTLVGGACGATSFELTSSEIPAGGVIDRRFEFRGFGCNGENESPTLKWMGAPAGAKSFAVTVFDPDAPTGSGWWHWVVVDIPPGVAELKAGAGDVSQARLPAGARQVRNDYGFAGWGGICPPPGARPHRYVFTVYALKTDRLGLGQDATPALAGFLIHANLLAKASFVATYGRPAR